MLHINMPLKKRLIEQLRGAIRDSGLTQLEIAVALEVDQPRVSRLINGQFSRWDGDIKKLCEMFGIDKESRVDASTSQILLDAINRNWDGSQEHAHLIASFIDELGAVSRYGSINK